MKICEIYVYPIKSLRPTQVKEAFATKYGFDYDRRFMLVKVEPDGSHKNMHVGAGFPQMTLFLTNIILPEDDQGGNGSIEVTFSPPAPAGSKTLKIPLTPNTEKLQTFEVTMHNSATQAFKMPSKYNDWFTACFGFDVILAYLGDGLRSVLFEEMKPAKSTSWLSTISSAVLGSSSSEVPQITFADCAPYLVVSKTSLENVSSRLPEGEEMDVTKFRPNIVVEGAKEPWEEDYWGKIKIGEAELTCAHNCVRCQSINIDYSTGAPGKGESGAVLKKMQKDRRVDKGAKYSPVFGRYSYWTPTNSAQIFKVGDEVDIKQMNPDRTVWSWKGLG